MSDLWHQGPHQELLDELALVGHGAGAATPAPAKTGSSCSATGRSREDRGQRGACRPPSTGAAAAHSGPAADRPPVQTPAAGPRGPRCSRQRTAPRSEGLPATDSTRARTISGNERDRVVGVLQGADQLAQRGVDPRQHQAEQRPRRDWGSSGTPSSGIRRPPRPLRPSGSGRCPDARCSGPQHPEDACAPPRHRGSRGRRPTTDSAPCRRY